MNCHKKSKWRYLWVITIAIPCLSQSQNANNALYIELLGSGLVYSVNYEHFISDNGTVRAGVSAFWSSSNSGKDQNTIITIPILYNYLSGSGNSKLEIGGGIDVMVQRGKSYGDIERLSTPNIDWSGGILLAGSIGYRYQPLEGGFLFRIVASPILSPYTGYFIPTGGVSFGTCF